MEFVRDRAGGEDPFFAYLPFTLPHSELVVPEHEDFLAEHWSDDETIVFVTADHGADDYPDEPFSSTDPLTGYKRDPYEGGIRVPMLVRWPGMVPADAVCEEPWYFADLLPTLAELAGLPQPSLPSEVDGISVLPRLLGDSQTGLRHRYLYW